MEENQGQQRYKYDIMYKRSKILKNWNKRQIILNFINNTLSLKSSSKKSKEKIINLHQYEIQWNGKTKKSNIYFFSLRAVLNINAQKYKRIYIGDVNEAKALDWKDKIETVIESKFV